MKSTKSLLKTIKALEKYNKKLNKLVALQQHKEEDGEVPDNSSISTVKEGLGHFQTPRRCLRQPTQRLC